MKDETILREHIEEVKKYMDEVGIDPESRFANEFIKQTKMLFRMHSNVREMKRNKKGLDTKTNILNTEILNEKTTKYIELLKEAKTLADELASVNILVD